MNNKWVVTLEEDPESGELILPFPEDMLEQLGWNTGDTLVFDADGEGGGFIIRKKE